MEAGKPGWNDSLNGLPAMMGSGLPEAIELMRIVRFLLSAPADFSMLPVELWDLALAVDAALCETDDSLIRWNGLCTAREAFRELTRNGVSGEEKQIETTRLTPRLERMLQTLAAGIEKAKKLYGPLLPTYLYHEMTDYRAMKGFIKPLAFRAHALPIFLEAPARLIRSLNAEDAQKLHAMVKNSALWDNELKLFKVCESLEGLPREFGRAGAFPRGWLENESIFLHMSYKYLLGLLESGAYEEFFAEMKTSFVPFFDAGRYGRSILENSSFIASSANPDPATHGRGFIARLSGATAEALSIWCILMTGGRPFVMKKGQLRFELYPKLPAWLFDQNGEVGFTMLGQTEFCIVNPEKRDTYTPDMHVCSYEVYWHDGSTEKFRQVVGPVAVRIRSGEAKRIVASMMPNS